MDENDPEPYLKDSTNRLDKCQVLGSKSQEEILAPGTSPLELPPKNFYTDHMSNRLKILTTIGYLTLLIGLGITDATFTSGLTIYPRNTYEVNRSETGVARKRDPEVFSVLQSLSIETSQTQKVSLLSRIAPPDVVVTSRVLLQDNEGLGYFAFVQSPDVRAIFAALKDSLLQSFSKDVHDVVDVVEAPEGRPIRNVLGFSDPSLSKDKIILVRVRERLYEFHVPEGKEPVVRVLIDRLTE